MNNIIDKTTVAILFLRFMISFKGQNSWKTDDNKWLCQLDYDDCHKTRTSYFKCESFVAAFRCLVIR